MDLETTATIIIGFDKPMMSTYNKISEWCSEIGVEAEWIKHHLIANDAVEVTYLIKDDKQRILFMLKWGK